MEGSWQALPQSHLLGAVELPGGGLYWANLEEWCCKSATCSVSNGSQRNYIAPMKQYNGGGVKYINKFENI